ncbi:hypothetical protein, partial [Chloroflexus sp.]|uniref:hypothetical protein n=1 Tax=Chloroflexus sp. TaxID=1904827 RepID=UPI002ADE03E9
RSGAWYSGTSEGCGCIYSGENTALSARLAVTHRMEGGSHAAALAVRSIRCRMLRLRYGPQERDVCRARPSDLIIRDELPVCERWHVVEYASSLNTRLLSLPATVVRVMEEREQKVDPQSETTAITELMNEDLIYHDNGSAAGKLPSML